MEREGQQGLPWEAPFGRLVELTDPAPEGCKAASTPALDELGDYLGSYTLEDRTVFVFDRAVLEVRRDGGVVNLFD